MIILPCPLWAGRRASDINWESGTAERSIGRINERERFLVSLSIFDDVFGTVEVEPVSAYLLDWEEEDEGFSSAAVDE